MNQDQSLNNDEWSVLDHIVELRTKIFISLGSILLISIIAHIYNKEIIGYILMPIGDQKLLFLSPLQPLFFILKIDLLVGLLCSFPIIVFCLISYLRPLLAKSFSAGLYIFAFASIALAFAGVAYAYFFTIPFSLNFLSSIVIAGIQNSVSAQSYLDFFIAQSAILVIIFQIPIFVLAGIYLRLVSTKFLSSKRRYVYLISTITLAVLTPTTDLFNLAIMLVPTIFIFELSMIAGRIMEFFRKS